MTLPLIWSNNPIQKFRKASDLFHSSTNAAISPTTAITIHPIGVAANTVLNASQTSLAVLMAALTPETAFPIVPIAPTTVPITTSIIPNRNAKFMMLCTVCWLFAIHSEPLSIRSLTFVSVLFTTGRRFFPSSSALLCIFCLKTSNFLSGVLSIASAISFVTLTPCFMLDAKLSIPPVSPSMSL